MVSRVSGIEDNSLKIGALYSLSGGWGKYGEAQVRAHEYWIDQVRDRGGIDGEFDVEIFVEDTSISSTQGVEKAKKLIKEYDVDVIIGPNSFGVRQSVSAITEKEQIPQLYFNPSGGKGVPDYSNEYMFNFGAVPAMAAGPEVVEYLTAEYGTDWYMLGSDISLSKELSKVIKKEVTRQEGSIMGENYVRIGHTDFSSILRDVRSTNPDVIYCPLTANSAISFMEQAENNGLRDEFQTVHFFLSHGAFESAESSVVKGALQTGEYFQNIDTELNRKFVSGYQKRYGKESGPYQYDGKVYHALQLLTEAVKQAKSTAPEDIKDSLVSLPSTATIYGESSIIYNNQAHIPYRIGRINSDREFEIEEVFGPMIPTK